MDLRISRYIKIACLLFFFSCQSGLVFDPNKIIYRDPRENIDARVNDLLIRMTLDEKIGQMALVEKNSVTLDMIAEDKIGGILSGGGGAPFPNTPQAWADMTDGFQKQALKNRLGIPLLYGADAVHGHNNVKGAVIFPHNIGLGATRDLELVKKIGRATAVEMKATGVFWNFAPCIAVPHDIRWGRTYEGFSENTALVSELGAAFLVGLQNSETGAFGSRSTVLGTPKHFIGDGATVWGASNSNFLLDQGDAQIDEAELRRLFLPPYAEAVRNGARCIMVSFSSWQGRKMHSCHYLLTQLLKGELNFHGFLVSDWKAIDQLEGDYYSDVVTSINAGLDMIMTPYDARNFCATLKKAVENGDVPKARIDDAVRRILRVKCELGLFERPFAERDLLSMVGSDTHRQLARDAVRKSLVLLKNDGTLPLSKKLPLLLIAGSLAEDMGGQCGGWTIEWQGKSGAITDGTTIREGIQSALQGQSHVHYRPHGDFEKNVRADVGIVVVGELPYAEGRGDTENLSLPRSHVELITRVRSHCKKLIVIVISGRPVIITDILPAADAVLAAWLPGSEGGGVADVIFGDFPFMGKLPYSWPKSMNGVPLKKAVGDEVLFPFGYGLH